ncbi:hypothetical protein H8E88_19110 [candidate division KSB1 bacterium]|nr:hypothetical protein [candidate division KSB1 bacterium]MBL7093259.1 hypothetical protein [candidate division KSB1 bacterium]
MEEKELIPEVIEKKTDNIFLKIFKNKNLLITSALLITIITFEFTTDFVEIFLGKVIELTNPFRPKAGTIWDMNKQDQLASDRLKEIAKNIPIRKNELREIKDLKELSEILETEQTVLLNPEQFRIIYNQIPPRLSFDIISPFDFLKLSHSRKWTWTKISKQENNLSFYFLDGDKQLLMDTYPPLTVLYNIPHENNFHSTSLDSMDMFRGRTFSREQFFTAFDELSNHVKLQLINNPYQLIKWEKDIRKVGISQYTTDNVVLIGFEINQNIYTEVSTFEASELAANFLIARLNELFPELYLEFPEKKYREYRYYDF